jgi:hypothetical protein
MMATTREELHRLIEGLPDADVENAKRLLEQVVRGSLLTTAAQRRLIETGLLLAVPDGVSSEEYWAYEPGPVTGRPISEILVEERR